MTDQHLRRDKRVVRRAFCRSDEMPEVTMEPSSEATSLSVEQWLWHYMHEIPQLQILQAFS